VVIWQKRILHSSFKTIKTYFIFRKKYFLSQELKRKT